MKNPNFRLSSELNKCLSPLTKAKINRLGHVLSRRFQRVATLDETLETMAEIALKKLDPSLRQEKILQRKNPH